MNELIKTEVQNDEVVVSGRELHDFLEVNTEYKKWFDRMCEYGFVEGVDFSPILTKSTGGRPSYNHAIKLDMAKEIAMIQRTPQGREHFNKRHDNVLRDIENLKKDVLNFEEMFFETTMPDSYGREQRVYLMNRNGFTLLTMGFTGKKALQFKLAYIEAFNKMERMDPIERAKLWIVQQEKLREIGTSISR